MHRFLARDRGVRDIGRTDTLHYAGRFHRVSFVIVDCPKCQQRHVILERASGTVARCDCGTEFALPHGPDDSAVKCANCGGNPATGATRCEYCDAHLATLRCRRCFATSIEGDRHCRACGHELAAPVRKLREAPDTVMQCPHCDEELVSVMVGDAVLDECRRCGGEWLSHDVFEEIVRDRRDQAAILDALKRLAPARQQRAERTATESERFYVKCPECRKIMDRRQFARISRVIVDICNVHGIWFDRQELSHIIEFVRDGGIEQAAEHRQQQLKSELWRQRLRSNDSVRDPVRITGRTSATLEFIESVVQTLLNFD